MREESWPRALLANGYQEAKATGNYGVVFEPRSDLEEAVSKATGLCDQYVRQRAGKGEVEHCDFPAPASPGSGGRGIKLAAK